MTGLQVTTSSPSSTSSTRSTPCVDGCCGPMLTRSRSGRSLIVGATSATPISWVLVPGVPGRRSVSGRTIDLSRDGEIDGLAAKRFRAAQRVPHPLVGQHDALQVRVPVELDTEQVEDFALVPVRARNDRGKTWRAVVGARLEPQVRALIHGI